jgi:hypothetical protein
MKKVTLPLLLLFALCAWAADFWQKPPEQWTDKEVQKMMTNSPWAREYTISIPPGGGGDFGGGGGPGGGGGGGARGGGGGGGDLGGGGGPPGSTNVQQLAPTVIARWQSALPIKQAFVRIKFGANAGTAPEARQLLEKADTEYVIVLSGNLRRLLMGPSAGLKKLIMDASALNVKGKDPVKPTALDIALEKDANDMVFHFAKAPGFTADDKEIEFDTKFGQTPIKFRFRPKEMIYAGKLEM